MQSYLFLFFDSPTMGSEHLYMYVNFRKQWKTQKNITTVPRGHDMNGRSQIKGVKNWMLPKDKCKPVLLRLSLAGNPEKNHFLCSSMGPNGGSFAMDSGSKFLILFRCQNSMHVFKDRRILAPNIWRSFQDKFDDPSQKRTLCLSWSCVIKVLVFLGPDHNSARNYRPCFRENQPKRSFSIKWKRAFWACFRENWVYKFGHCTRKYLLDVN